MSGVAITGVGVLTPLGASLAATRAALAAAPPPPGPATLFDSRGFPERRAAEVPNFDPRPHFRTPKAIKLTDRRTRLAVAAGSMALADAGWPEGEEDGLGVVVGTSGSDLQVADLVRAVGDDPAAACARDTAAFAERVLPGLNPLWLLVNLPNMASAHVAIQLGARGPNNTVMTDAVAGLQAVAEGADWVRRGEIRAVLAGGADTALHPFAYAALAQQGRLRAQGAFVPAEGAALFLLEPAEAARGTACARVCGSGTAAEIGDGPSALERALDQALDEAGWDARAVSQVALAGLPGADAEDERSLAARFPGASCRRLDPALGHALAAAAPILLALALDAPAGARLVVAARGLGGQAAALAVVREETRYS